MAWDRGRYYYRSIWTLRGPRRVYVGTGLVARVAEFLDAQRAASTALAAARHRQERRQEHQIDADLDGHYKALRTHVHATLVASGWYAHKRVWRRYNVIVEGDPMTDAITTKQSVLTAADIEALLERCNVANPHAGDLADLRRIVSSPEGVSLRVFSGMTLATEIAAQNDKRPVAAIVTSGEMARLRRDLGGDDAAPIERALIDHVVTCWIRMQLAEATLTRVTSKEHTYTEGAYREKRLTEAQRRYLRALGLLARLRALTTVQVNIAQNQQVNNR